MQIMVFKHYKRLAFALMALPLLAACSETSMLDAFDSGNRGPEEGLVANKPLSVPPDLSLRQPGAASAPAYNGNTQGPAYNGNTQGNGLQVQQGQRGALNPVYQAPPPPQTTQPAQQPAWQNSATAPQQPAPQTPAAPQAQATNPADAPYIKHGINPYNADGTRKKQAVLDAEARAKKLELKRAQNPNYGTVFNSGELWSSN